MKNKDVTKRKLLAAVGDLIWRSGFRGLKISAIARHAEVDRKLIYRYFSSLDGLIEAYILENDYWMTFAEKVRELIATNEHQDSKELITTILQNQFKFFHSEKEMQRLILLELSEKNEMMKSIHYARESMGQQLLESTDPHFAGSAINFRAVAALIVGGIYYIVLHTRFNGDTFADIRVNSDDGQQEILKTIAQIIQWAYQCAESKN